MSHEETFEGVGNLGTMGTTKVKAKQGASGIEVTKVVAKTVLGAGIGVTAGIVGALLVVEVLEVAVPALLITKAAGVVGGTAGLLFGVGDTEKKRAKAKVKISL